MQVGLNQTNNCQPMSFSGKRKQKPQNNTAVQEMVQNNSMFLNKKGKCTDCSGNKLNKLA